MSRLPQQLDIGGGFHDLAPTHERVRLFEPAPAQLAGQAYLDHDERGDERMSTAAYDPSELASMYTKGELATRLAAAWTADRPGVVHVVNRYEETSDPLYVFADEASAQAFHARYEATSTISEEPIITDGAAFLAADNEE